MPDERDSPIVVVGMGGSGSRAIAQVLREAGVYMGSNTNGIKEDALEFAEFDYRWAPPYLAALREGRPSRMPESMREEHLECVAAHRRDAGAGVWGWKHCPSGHLLPFIAEQHPGLRLVHVVRDGRDIAFGQSGGRTHTLRLGRAVLDGDPEPVVPGAPMWKGKAPTADGGPEATIARQASFWARVNGGIADWGEEADSGSYLRVRLESFAEDPDRLVPELLAFAGLPTSSAEIDRLCRFPQTQDSWGRWKTESWERLESVWDAAGEQLTRFGYGERTQPPFGGR